MAVETRYGLNGAAKLQDFPPGLAFAGNHGGRVRQITDRIAALPNGASIASIIYLGKVPSSAVLNPASEIWWGAAGASVTLNIGDPNDDDALATLIDISSAGSSKIMEAAAISASAGKRLWELLGRTSDPDQDIDLIAKIAGAAVSTATAAFAWNILYSND